MHNKARSRFLTLASCTAAAAFAGAAAAVPPPGILAHWTFDQTGAATAVDSVNGLNGTLSGGAAMVAGGVSGGALQLSTASASFVNMGAILPLSGTQPCTISFWCKTTPGITTTQFAVTKHATNSHNGYIVGLNTTSCYGATGRALSYRSNNCGGEAISTTATVNDGQWHFIASTYHPTTGTRLYVDGGPPEAIVGGVSVAGNNAPFLVGGVTVAGVPTAIFDGMIDDVQVYGRALTCHELNMLFTQPGIESTVEADLNGDGVVDGADLGILLGAWGTPACDLDGNGVVDGADLGIVLGKWGSC